MIEFRYDTQLLIEGEDLDEDAIREYFENNFKGDCLLAVGDDELIKIHYHTNEPWDVLKYCRTLGEIYDIVAGKFFICGLGEEDFASLPKELQKKYEDRFRQPEAFLKIGSRIMAIPTEPEKASTKGKSAPAPER